MSEQGKEYRKGLFASGTVRRAIVALLSIGYLLSTALPASATQVVPLSLNDTIRLADAVVVGTVTARRSRWGDSTRRWILTDFTLAVESVLYPSESGEPIGSTITLTYWGGTMEGETQGIADQQLPAVGERIVTLLRSGWAKGGFSPVVGLHQGLLRVTAGTGASVRESVGRPLALLPDGQVVRRSASESAAGEVSLGTFVEWLRKNVEAIKKGKVEADLGGNGPVPGAMPVFAKAPKRIAELLSSGPIGESRLPHAEHEPQAPGAPTSPPTAVTTAQTVEGPRSEADYATYTQGFPPIVVNNFPDSFAPWSPEDEYQMSKWNYYSTELFRVYTTPSGTYGWPDGIFDLDGWPSNADVQYVYGYTWEAGTIGICFYRLNGSGYLVEADIALNPAFSFTLNDEVVYGGSSLQSFRQVMVHELGHMHGLDHNFTFMSVMNYFPSMFRAFGLPYMDDAEGVRANYPSRAVSRTDLGVYLYRSTGGTGVAEATYPSSVTAGQIFSVNNYHVENVGTTTIANATIEWYLTTSRNFNTTYYYLGERTYGSLQRFHYFTPSSMTVSFFVPTSIPTGQYYLAAYIRNDAGASQGTFPFSNNYAFTRFRISISSPPVTTTTAASAITSTTATLNGTVNPNAFTATTAFEYGPTVAYGSTVAAQGRSGTTTQAISASLTLPCGTLIHFRARATTIIGTTYGADLVLTTAACPGGLVNNGGFGGGLTGWSAFGSPEPTDIVWRIQSGVFEFYRTAPAAGSSNQAVVFQNTGAGISSGTPLTARFTLGNSSAVRKRISVLIHDADFSDLVVCTFWLSPGAALATYEMRTSSTKAWSNLSISFYAASAESQGGYYRLDDVTVYPDPSGLLDQTRCVDPRIGGPGGGIDGPELITNGTFGSGVAGWGVFGQIQYQVLNGVFEFYRPAGVPAGVILQPTGAAIPTTVRMTATLELGNSSPVRKRVTVLIHDADFSDLAACTFWLAPGQPLSSYTMRMLTTKAWTNATLSVYPSTIGTETWIRLDNVSLKRSPASPVAGIDCLGPSPATAPSQAVRSVPVASPKANPPVDVSRSVAIDLTRATSASIQFVSFITQAVWARIEVSLDGETWEFLADVPPFTDLSAVELDLSRFSGRVVRLRLVAG